MVPGVMSRIAVKGGIPGNPWGKGISVSGDLVSQPQISCVTLGRSLHFSATLFTLQPFCLLWKDVAGMGVH